jgi:hypothetical protein
MMTLTSRANEAAMVQSTGKYYPVSYFRRLVSDLMQFAAAVPSVTIERRMNLARLVEARKACTPSPTWSAIFIKAYSIVAARTCELRTAYMKFPWPRFYEHAANIATLNVDRQLENERIVLQVHLPSPETRSLADLDALIRDYQQQPVENIPAYRTAVRMSRVPWPIRQWLWWGALNMFGSKRCQHFGTFSITSIGAHGAGIVHLVPLLTSTLHYDMFDANGGIAMRLSFDHRVLDAAAAAGVLEDLETALLSDVLDECMASAPGVPGNSMPSI